LQHCQARFSAAAACDKIVCSAFVQSAVIGFGNMAGPDSAPSPSGNVAEKFPPAGGMGDWGLPQQARLSYKRYACNCAAQGGRGFLNSADNTPYEKNGDEVRSLADAVKSTRT